MNAIQTTNLKLSDPEARVIKILEMIAQPTAPFYEHLVAKAIVALTEEICCHQGVSLSRDRIGNLVLAYRPEAPKKKTIIYAAHMDHPGFIVRAVNGTQLRLRRMGGAPSRFCVGARILVYDTDGRSGPAIITEQENDLIFLAEFQQPIPDFHPGFGAFDLCLFGKDQDRVWGLAMDDLAGCALALATFERLINSSIDIQCLAVFHRAEEVGFVGAAGLAMSGLIPDDTLFISLEASKAMPDAELNCGPVVRVGDKRFRFDPNAEIYLDLARDRLISQGYSIQKRIMPGGTCESSIYRAVGFGSTAIAVPLLNYHNTGTDRVEAEIVGLYDLNVGVELLQECAVQYSQHQGMIYSEFLAEALHKLQEADSLFTAYLDPSVEKLPLLNTRTLDLSLQATAAPSCDELDVSPPD